MKPQLQSLSSVKLRFVSAQPLLRSFPTDPCPRIFSQLSRRILRTERHTHSFSVKSHACWTYSWSGTPLNQFRALTSPRIRHEFTRRYTDTPNRNPSSTPQDDSHSHSHTYKNLVYPAVIAALLTTTAITILDRLDEQNTSKPINYQEAKTLPDMSTPMLPGRPGHLTPEEEEKLRKLWNSIFQLCGVAESEETSDTASAQEDASVAESGEPKKKSRFGMFKKNDKSGSSTPTTSSMPKDAEDDKYGQMKQFQETVAKESSEAIRQTIWGMVKHDHPDALVLRFLRARKWDVEKALAMFVSTMHWRHSEMHVDDDIMKKGEGGMVEDEKNGSPEAKIMGHDFQEQIRMGKSFLHGVDKQGRPICVVRVRFHKQGEQCEESLERYTVYLIETARMVLSPPVDTATIIFDMTGFSMANMDYTPVKFMIKCFEANYPESLGAVLVHKSPWVFQGIWKIIRGWLDPVVASKVQFTNNKAELQQFIEPSKIIKELEGDENWEFKYVEPVPGENDKMKDTATRDQLLTAREGIVKQFEEATREWIRNPEGDKGKQIRAKRDSIATQLKEDYWKLDPYLRARSLYDRQGSLLPDGKTNWYGVQAASATATSADDVD